MREIKFRSWYPGSLVGMTFMNSDTLKHNCCQARELIEILNGKDKKNILMQYTGLKDKNGVEIYEGDIINFEHDNKFHVIYYIVFRECNFAITDYKSKIHNFWLGSKRIKDLEIIGNIYENPELLENN